MLPADDAYAFLIAEEGSPARELAALATTALKDALEVRNWWAGKQAGLFAVRLVDDLRGAAVVLADLRTGNPNVYYEIGLAHAFRTPVICIATQADDLAADIKGLSVLEVPMYNGAISRDEFQLQLRDAVNDTIGKEPVTAVSVADQAATAHAVGDSDQLWRDLALLERLAPVRAADAEVGMQVVHLTFGVGRVVGVNTVGRERRIVAEFGKGTRELRLRDPRLFLAEIQALRR